MVVITGRECQVLAGWEHLSEDEISLVEQGIIEGASLGGPLHMELHLTNECDVCCFFCLSRNYSEAQVMEWPLLENLLRQGVELGSRFIRLSGSGEPLVYPHFSALLDLYGELGYRLTELTTTGVALAPYASKLVKNRADRIFVTLNEIDSGHYARTMQVDEMAYHRAVEGIEAVAEASAAAPEALKPCLAIQFFIGPHNYRQLPDMLQFCVERGVDEAVVKYLGTVSEDHPIPEAEIPEFKAVLSEVLDEDCKSGKPRLRFDLGAASGLQQDAVDEQMRKIPQGEALYPEFRDHEPRREYCYMGWYGVTVIAKGHIFPCGSVHKDMGDLHNQSLDEIWRGQYYQEYRSQMRRLMLLRGEMRYSPRRTGLISPVCIEKNACPNSYNLASQDFYGRVSQRMESDWGLWGACACVV